MTYNAPVAPAPYAPARDVCGATPALILPPYETAMCPDCTRRDVLENRAHDHLQHSGGEAIAVWAHHWKGVGLPMKTLLSTLQAFMDRLEGDSGEFDGASNRERRMQALEAVMEEHPAVTYEPVGPARWLAPCSPMRVLEVEEVERSARLLCVVETGEEFERYLYTGQPMSAVPLESGDVLLTCLPLKGSRADSFLIPAHLAPQVLKLAGFDIPA